MMTLLTHWGRVTHICVGKLTIIGSDNGLSPERCQSIIWTNAGILLIGPVGTNLNEILIEIQTFSLKKIRLKMSSAKCCSFLLGLNVLIEWCKDKLQWNTECWICNHVFPDVWGLNSRNWLILLYGMLIYSLHQLMPELLSYCQTLWKYHVITKKSDHSFGATLVWQFPRRGWWHMIFCPEINMSFVRSTRRQMIWPDKLHKYFQNVTSHCLTVWCK